MKKARFILVMVGILVVLILLAAQPGQGLPRALGQAATASIADGTTPGSDTFLAIIWRASTPTPTSTPIPPTPTITPTLSPGGVRLFCSIPVAPIPGGGSVSDTFFIQESGTILDLDVYINTEHTWVGDLTFQLEHDDTNTTALLIDRPGRPVDELGCDGEDIDAVLDDDAPDPVEDECNPIPPAIVGEYSPNEALSSFNNENISGDWTMTVTDAFEADDGALMGWCLLAWVSD